jgi:hypothetical protein
MVFFGIGILFLLNINTFAASLLGPSPYLSTSDSPFSTLSFNYYYLENFEDSALNTPGVTASQGFIWPDPAYFDSVDGDDGVIDGSGSKGKSFGIKNNAGITFSFNKAILGSYPTHAGIVWTDAYAPTSTSIYFQAFDVLGSSLGVFGPWTVGDGTTIGTTAEDRFFGVINLEGISAIKIYQGASQMEIDHLQYGSAVPIPSALWLLGTGIFGIVALRNRVKE